MQWRGFEIYQNDKFAKIYSKHRNMNIHEIGGNKCYALKAPIFGNIKFRCYLYQCRNYFEFLEEAISFCQKTGILILEILTLYDLDDILKSKFNYLRVEHNYTGTYVTDLNLSESELWMNMSKVCRQNIKKANKNNVIIKETTCLKDFDTWWKIYNDTGKRGQFVKQSYDIVKEIFDTEDISRLFVAIYENKIVAGAFLLIHKIPVWWLGGSLPDYWEYMPNNLLLWEIIKWAQKENYEIFDFGGAIRDHHGPSEFKRKFGGEYKENHNYSITLKPFKLKVIDKMIKLRYKVSKKH